MKQQRGQNDKVNAENEDMDKSIGFVFKKCTAPKASLAYWMGVPEFVENIKKAQNDSQAIDNKVVFDIMKKIYLQKNDERKAGVYVGFNFHLARHALKVLSEDIFGNRDFWNN